MHAQQAIHLHWSWSGFKLVLFNTKATFNPNDSLDRGKPFRIINRGLDQPEGTRSIGLDSTSFLSVININRAEICLGLKSIGPFHVCKFKL